MHRFYTHLAGNAVAYVALFVALGGTSYAALSLPAGSVGAAQIRSQAVSPAKLDGRFISGNVRAWAVVGANGRLFAGGGRPTVTADSPYPGAFDIKWGVTVGRNCSPIATIQSNHSPITEHIPVPGNPSIPFTAGYPVTWNAGGKSNVTFVYTLDQQGQLTPLGFDVAMIC